MTLLELLYDALRVRALIISVFLLLVAPGMATAAENSHSALFDFHSGFWINLHHFLYREAVVAAPQTGPRALAVNHDDADELNTLSAVEKSSWDAAVSFYQKSLASRDLLFDDGMIAIKNNLEDAEASADLAGVEIPAELKAVLLKVAPVYRKHWWAKHDRQNRQWTADLQALIAKYGEGIASSLGKIYQVPWPTQPVRVDAVAYANWAGAYTSRGPTRPTISTTGPSNQGPAALEIVFHETSHGLIDKVLDVLQQAEDRVNAQRGAHPFPFRRDLWHQVLFYTSGELVAERIPGYVPYADKNGLWNRGWSLHDRELIEQDWKPHMEGKAGMEAALKKLAEDLAKTE